MLNTLHRIWHSIFFGLLNSAQHHAETPQWLTEREERGNVQKEERLCRGAGGRGRGELEEERRRKEEKWRTSSQMRIGMDLEIDQS